MASQILQAITKNKLDNLYRSFDTSYQVFWNEDKGRLNHAGEYGEYREKAARELISLFIPQTMSIGEGFIITSDGKVSTQCDLIVYDPQSCPNLINETHQNFFPVECVIAVGEIKSTISCASDMSEILNKLSEIKSLKERVNSPSAYRSHDGNEFCPSHREYDQIFTFVLAQSIPNMPDAGFLYHDEIENRHKHNFIVGIDGGHACYKKGDINSYYYPQTELIEHAQVSCPKEEQSISVNFGILLTAIFRHCQTATLLELNPIHYLADVIVSGDSESGQVTDDLDFDFYDLITDDN